MRIVRRSREMPLPAGHRGFVPTMGALHAGHRSLIEAARKECDEVVISIFVNPKQFGDSGDLRRYPRTEADDLLMAEEAGADIVFIPSVNDIYPHGLNSITVSVSGVTEKWEGAARPGHFDGVTTVVAKLFSLVQPTTAYFGRKDLQQCAVIKRMVSELNYPIAIDVKDTIRDKDGLALSSRNRFLTPSGRQHAREIPAILQRIRSEILDSPQEPIHTIIENRATSLPGEISLEYLALVDTDSMETVIGPVLDASLIIAARIDSVRLIDNLRM